MATSEKPVRSPRLRDFAFVVWLDPKSPSRHAVALLAEYAANAVNFFNDRRNRYLVESLANTRKFAEYVVVYVEVREKISLPPADSDGRRGTFARRLENIVAARPDLQFPHRPLTRIWRDAGDAVHPPDGVTEKHISDHKSACRIKAGEALADALAVAEWMRAHYRTMSWFSRLRFWWRNRSKAA